MSYCEKINCNATRFRKKKQKKERKKTNVSDRSKCRRGCLVNELFQHLDSLCQWDSWCSGYLFLLGGMHPDQARSRKATHGLLSCEHMQWASCEQDTDHKCQELTSKMSPQGYIWKPLPACGQCAKKEGWPEPKYYYPVWHLPTGNAPATVLASSASNTFNCTPGIFDPTFTDSALRLAHSPSRSAPLNPPGVLSKPEGKGLLIVSKAVSSWPQLHEPLYI